LFRKHSLKRTLKQLVVLGVLALTVSAAFAQDNPMPSRAERAATARPLPTTIDGLRLDAPVHVSGTEAAFRVAPELRSATGKVQVVVRLSQSPAALAAPDSSAAAVSAAGAQQAQVVSAARALDGNAKVLGNLRVALNAVILEVDASALAELSRNPNVVAISPVRNYEIDLSETVPYIGATEVQNMGYDGSGVKVAVLDSGIDYTHVAFGGSGSVEEYEANDPAIIEPGTFPTARVVGGYDFVGGDWPNAPLAPDPDPIDNGPGAGHGTHVADIIGGVMGVAPGVDLYAVKVCSSVSTSCSGVALLNGMEFALDPNGDGSTSDRVDIINMSLGSPYGDPRWDDLSQAVENASAAGILTVASAGNSSDKPYALGSPSSAPSALSVAQTTVPSAVQPLMEVTEPADIAGLYAAVFQPWSVEPAGVIEGPLQYGDGAGGNLNGCAPFAAGTLTGKIVLVDRGVCSFSIKISNIAEGGALAGIIGLVAPGEPFAGSYGGGDPSIPGYMISQPDADTLRSGLDEGVTVRFDPANGIPLVQHMVGSSSRGPSVGLNQAKPEIGAPGGSVSAIYGTGSGTEAFSGTSGAAPMVSGSAALVMDAYPDRSWAEVKAVLMNTGETDIMNEAEFFGGYPAAISRIGGGEVRVNHAVASPLAAWEKNDLTGGLSWGFHDVSDQLNLDKRITIMNYGDEPLTLKSEVTYRYGEDASQEVQLSVPSWFTVPAGKSVTIPVHLFIRPRTDRPLHDWVLNSGSAGANPDALTFVEYDGYVYFRGVGDDSDVQIHMPWHVLPRGAGDIQTGAQQNGFTWVRNAGKSASYIDTYSLLGASGEQADPAYGANVAPADFRYVGVQTYPVPAGFCSDEPSFLMGLAANTWDRYSHANNIWIEFDLDTDGDGDYEYAVFNFDASGQFSSAPSDGRSLAWVYDIDAGTADAFFYTQHETNSGNFVLYFCGEQIGMNADDFFTTSMNVDAYAFDWYYSGTVGDAIEGMNIVPLGERYLTFFENGDVGYTVLPPKSDKLFFGVFDFGDQFNATENGVLWLYGPGAPADNEVKAWMFGN